MRKPLTMLCAVAGVMALSGCTGLEVFRASRVRTERQRVLQLYGECLQQTAGDMRVLAKYCTATAESRFNRENNAPEPSCPVSEWLSRLDDP